MNPTNLQYPLSRNISDVTPKEEVSVTARKSQGRYACYCACCLGHLCSFCVCLRNYASVPFYRTRRRLAGLGFVDYDGTSELGTCHTFLAKGYVLRNAIHNSPCKVGPMVSIVAVPISLALATGWLYLLTLLAPSPQANDNSGGLKFPGSYDELKELAELLSSYKNNHAVYVLVLFSSAYLYKQTFAIPGSVFLNVLSGALFGVCGGFLLTCTLSALGASQCYMLSKLCGQHYLECYFPERVRFLQQKVQENKHRLLYWLLFLRLFPMTPNWFLNVASPIIDVPLHLFSISVFIGLMPYNFICVQTGSILSEVKSLNDILSWNTVAKLIVAAAVALLPSVLLKRKANSV